MADEDVSNRGDIGESHEEETDVKVGSLDVSTHEEVGSLDVSTYEEVGSLDVSTYEEAVSVQHQHVNIDKKVERLASSLLSREENNEDGAEGTVDDRAIGELASKVKEHDVMDEEIKQAKQVKEDLEKELEENDGWVKILGNDQLMKKIIQEGLPNTRPTRGEVCTVNIEGRLRDDETVVFESQDKFTFQLGDGEVLTGLDLAIPLMCKGEVSSLSVAPRFGYGKRGLPPLVPPNAHLLYTVQVIDFSSEKDLEELTLTKRRGIGIKKRERGNWWYGRGEITLAIQCYRRALEFLDEDQGGIVYPKTEDPDEKTKFTEDLRLLFDDRLKTYNNMAAAQLKLQAYGPALASVDAVLRCQPENVKALFRKGMILGGKGDIDEAIAVFKQVVKLEPENKAAHKELTQLASKRKESREKEKLLYQRMFNTSGTNGDKKSPDDPKKPPYKKPFNIALLAGGIFIAAASIMAYRYIT